MNGTLMVKPKSAQLIYDTEYFGTMDPFVEVQIGSQKRKTKVAKNAGKLPAWVDEFQFNVTGTELLTFKIYDHDTFSRNDFIGEGNFYLSNIGGGAGGRTMQSLPITRKGKAAGQLVIEFQMFLNNQNTPQQQQFQQHPQNNNNFNNQFQQGNQHFQNQNPQQQQQQFQGHPPQQQGFYPQQGGFPHQGYQQQSYHGQQQFPMNPFFK